MTRSPSKQSKAILALHLGLVAGLGNLGNVNAADLDTRITAPAPPNFGSQKGNRPLPQAVEKPKLRGDDALNTALVTAVLGGNHSELRSALSKGADPDTSIFVNYQGQRPTLSVLTIASLLSDLIAVEELLQAGAGVGEESCEPRFLIPLLEPVNSIVPPESGRRAVFANIVRSQQAMRCDLHSPYRLDADNRDHAFIAVVKKGDLESVKKLVSARADKNARESKLPGKIIWPGRTALMTAIIERRFEVAEYLIDAGADVNAKASVGSKWGSRDGFTALMLVSQSKSTDLAKKLIASGADVTLADEDNRRAIHDAAAAGNQEIVRAILESLPAAGRKDMIVATAKGGQTALVLAVQSRRPDVVRYLADAGRDVMGADYLEFWGNSALIEAVTHREFGTQREEDRLISRQRASAIAIDLLEKGADAKAKDGDGTPVLIRAIREGSDLDVIRSLVAHKADGRAPDDSGRDAYHYARERADGAEVLKILSP